ncbi:hypothetical protein BD410DRAFT_564245 [Rickenella mellea]|uniref:Uncharacterized protein n=1 Tax=Rickenella mellea TaxID=50990 RepID=A0A4Y7QEF9_9AGAM|nr:hypothetical protein BD410DRAFT_564245 [Rickenella mellea]
MGHSIYSAGRDTHQDPASQRVSKCRTNKLLIQFTAPDQRTDELDVNSKQNSDGCRSLAAFKPPPPPSQHGIFDSVEIRNSIKDRFLLEDDRRLTFSIACSNLSPLRHVRQIVSLLSSAFVLMPPYYVPSIPQPYLTILRHIQLISSRSNVLQRQ